MPPDGSRSGRDRDLFAGPLEAVFLIEVGGFSEGSNLWWPQDRTWCVASGIDCESTYVGGSRACVDAVMRSPDLGAMEVQLTHAIA